MLLRFAAEHPDLEQQLKDLLAADSSDDGMLANPVAKSANVRMYQHDELFAPTRDWSEEASGAIYEQYGIDAGLVITLGARGE